MNNCFFKNKNENETSFIYMHSVRGFYDKDKNILFLSSSNIIDFFAEVFKEVHNAFLVLPIDKPKKNSVAIKVGNNTQVFNVNFSDLLTTTR